MSTSGQMTFIVHSGHPQRNTMLPSKESGLYLAVLEAMDRQFEKLFSFLQSDPALRDNTLLLICSDNGCELGARPRGPSKATRPICTREVSGHLWLSGGRDWWPGKPLERETRNPFSPPLISRLLYCDLPEQMRRQVSATTAKMFWTLFWGKPRQGVQRRSFSDVLPIGKTFMVSVICRIWRFVRGRGNFSVTTMVAVHNSTI